MVNVSIDVTDLGGEARPGDKVVFWRPRMGGSATHAGRVISTAPVTVFLTNGKATVSNVEPGEMTVLLQCRGVESQGPVTVGVPDGNGTVTLRALLESQFTYAPPIVSAVQEAAANASASEEAAIRAQVRSEAAADRAEDRVDDAINNGANLIRAEVKQDADRAVSARQAATQSESKAKASENAAASSASRAKTSETNAKQSEDNAGDYAAVATTAATEAVDAMERATDLAGGDFATHEYVDSGLDAKADKSYVDGADQALDQEIQAGRWRHQERLTSADNIDLLVNEDDQHMYVCASTVAGLPIGQAGWLTVYHERVSRRTTQVYVSSGPNTAGYWTRKTNIDGSEWGEWERFNPRQIAQDVEDARWLHPVRLDSATNIDTLTTEADQGLYVCASTVAGLPIRQAGWLTVYHERVSRQTMQVYVSSSPDTAGHWTRKTIPNSSVWGEWERFDPRSSAGGGNARDTLVTLGHAATPWETAKLVASYEQGELYLDQVAAQVPFVSKETIGLSSGGNPISGLLLGDEGKPIVYIDCATHGDEVSSREAMLIWLKMVASRRARWMDHVSAFVVPTLNVDRINAHRLTIDREDINRDYVDQALAETQANVAAVQAKDPIFYVACHEYRSDSRGDIGILMQPTNQSWLPDETVKSVSGRIYDEIRDRLTSEGIDSGPYPQAFNPDTPPVQAHFYMSSVLNIPSMLIEGPGILGALINSGSYPSPRRYVPSLEKRIHDYMLVFDQIMESAAVIAQERAEA